MNCKHHMKGDGSWWAVDGRGIELCRVCGKCEREKLSHYAPEVLGHYTSADVDESIEEEEPPGLSVEHDYGDEPGIVDDVPVGVVTE